MATRFYLRTTNLTGKSLVGGWDQDRRLQNRVIAPGQRILTQSRTTTGFKLAMNNVVEDSRKNTAMFLLESPPLAPGQTIDGTVTSLWECAQNISGSTSAQACAQIFVGIVDRNDQLLATLIPLKSGSVSSLWTSGSTKRYFAWAQSVGSTIGTPVLIDPSWDAPRLRVEVGVSQQNTLTGNATYGPWIYGTSNNASDLSGADGNGSYTSYNAWVELSDDILFTADVEVTSVSDCDVSGRGSYYSEQAGRHYVTAHDPTIHQMESGVATDFTEKLTTDDLFLDRGEEVFAFIGGSTCVNYGSIYDTVQTHVQLRAQSEGGEDVITYHRVGGVPEWYDWTGLGGVAVYEAKYTGNHKFSLWMAKPQNDGVGQFRDASIVVFRRELGDLVAKSETTATHGVGTHTLLTLDLPPNQSFFVMGSVISSRAISTNGQANYAIKSGAETLALQFGLDAIFYGGSNIPLTQERQVISPFCFVETGAEGKTITLDKIVLTSSFSSHSAYLVAIPFDRIGGIQRQELADPAKKYGPSGTYPVISHTTTPGMGKALVVAGPRNGMLTYGQELSIYLYQDRERKGGVQRAISQGNTTVGTRAITLVYPYTEDGLEHTLDLEVYNNSAVTNQFQGVTNPAIYVLSLDHVPTINKGDVDIEAQVNVDIDGDIPVMTVIHDAGEVGVESTVDVAVSPLVIRQSSVSVEVDPYVLIEPGVIRTAGIDVEAAVNVSISGKVIQRSHYFRDNLLRFLPGEFAYQDRSIGDLEDFLQVVSLSMDEFDSFIEEFTTIFDVDTCETKYLPYLAKMIGYPLSERDDEDSQRTQLREAVSWYKRKGLTESFRILFYSLGYVINLVELWTKDYETFHKYPGSFLPRVFRAEVFGTSAPTVSVSSNTCALRIRIDGSPAVDIRLTPDVSKPLETIAQEIQVRLVDVGGQCVVDGGQLVIRSLESGQESSVRLEDVPLSAYSILGLYPGTWYGFDPVVPDYFDELKENGGEWYKSPHFGIEVFAIKDYVLDPEEFWYIRDRIELVRPAHTVLDWIDYVKALADTFSVSESDFIAELTPGQIDVWPFPICIDRGENSQFEYLRDGLVPNRSEVTRVAYQHYRLVVDTAPRRNQFEYEYYILSRDSETGPTPMPTRGEIHYYRDGMPIGDPKRDSCGYDVEEVNIHLAWEEAQSWCIALYRDGGAKYRDQPDTWYRDGSFTLVTSRDPYYLDRDGLDMLLDRSGCYTPLDADLGLLFERPDLPGVWFTSLDAMSDPESLGITELLPQPGEDGPGI